MAHPAQILSVLELLSSAFPEASLSERSLALYLEHLSDLPAWLLRQAAEQHMRSSSWFPRIDRLRRLAAEIAGIPGIAAASELTHLPPSPHDYLTYQAQALEDAFYHAGILDPAAWRSLAAQFESADRPHRAARTLEKLSSFLSSQIHF